SVLYRCLVCCSHHQRRVRRREPASDLASHCIYLFLLKIAHPPPSTLFPYTTLFRSPLGIDRPVQVRPCSFDLDVGFIDAPGIKIDRKSTRLNSSHSQISYAVFCLKKKRSCTKLRWYTRYRWRRDRVVAV